MTQMPTPKMRSRPLHAHTALGRTRRCGSSTWRWCGTLPESRGRGRLAHRSVLPLCRACCVLCGGSPRSGASARQDRRLGIVVESAAPVSCWVVACRISLGVVWRAVQRVPCAGQRLGACSVQGHARHSVPRGRLPCRLLQPCPRALLDWLPAPVLQLNFGWPTC